MFSQYLRLDLSIHASGCAVVRAAARLLHPDIWHERRFRRSRKKFYSEMLGYHAKARKLARDWRL